MKSSQIKANLFSCLSGRWAVAQDHAIPGAPLIVAIHGGSYTSEYFDVRGYSLFDRASALGLPIIGPDRPGYGMSIKLEDARSDIQGQAAYLLKALEQAWQLYGNDCPGMVIIAHSIGAAIALTIAADNRTLPLLGVAVSGVGLRTPAHFVEAWENLPGTSVVEMSAELKDDVMFGPCGSFTSDMPMASHRADSTALRAELLDIVGGWSGRAREVLGKISVPVHYRQADADKLWIVDQNEVTQFAQALTSAPRVDAQLVDNTGHCMDFHRVGAALQVQQLGFALQCAIA
ncbi:alpha/beta hydrolase [Pseudomaricurvus alkylphenolicus]|uniref:alpha/beta hydrolase n=1 Tax=Pseudomaricurvus alkylphenolicus TaxID=1306991 RepID=UPI001421363C|nr:alpha/beta hydrolase [Pseudomaricurvus alkylphenolicus]NIB43398.1 alpha/beta hydrolase [Pseudomaricurvus alkylphenolicus]